MTRSFDGNGCACPTDGFPLSSSLRCHRQTPLLALPAPGGIAGLGKGSEEEEKEKGAAGLLLPTSSSWSFSSRCQRDAPAAPSSAAGGHPVALVLVGWRKCTRIATGSTTPPASAPRVTIGAVCGRVILCGGEAEGHEGSPPPPPPPWPSASLSFFASSWHPTEALRGRHDPRPSPPPPLLLLLWWG